MATYDNPEIQAINDRRYSGNGYARPPGNATGVVTDPDSYFNKVVALLHFEGTPASATFTNSAVAANTWQDNGGSTKINNNRAKFGSTSLNCTSATQGIVPIGSTAPYTIGTQDYTIEGWFFIVSQALDFNAAKGYFDMRNSSLVNGNFPSLFGTVADGSLVVSFNASTVITAPSNTMLAGVWTHLALCRIAGNTKLFAQGLQVGSTWVDANTYAQPGSVTLMSAGNNAATVVGSLDDFRYTIGVGRYPANFIPPIAQLPDH